MSTHTHTHTHAYSLPSELLYSEEPTRGVAAAVKYDFGLEEEWKMRKNLAVQKSRGKGPVYTPRPGASHFGWKVSVWGEDSWLVSRVGEGFSFICQGTWLG